LAQVLKTRPRMASQWRAWAPLSKGCLKQQIYASELSESRRWNSNDDMALHWDTRALIRGVAVEAHHKHEWLPAVVAARGKNLVLLHGNDVLSSIPLSRLTKDNVKGSSDAVAALPWGSFPRLHSSSLNDVAWLVAQYPGMLVKAPPNVALGSLILSAASWVPTEEEEQLNAQRVIASAVRNAPLRKATKAVAGSLELKSAEIQDVASQFIEPKLGGFDVYLECLESGEHLQSTYALAYDDLFTVLKDQRVITRHAQFRGLTGLSTVDSLLCVTALSEVHTARQISFSSGLNKLMRLLAEPPEVHCCIKPDKDSRNLLKNLNNRVMPAVDGDAEKVLSTVLTRLAILTLELDFQCRGLLAQFMEGEQQHLISDLVPDIVEVSLAGFGNPRPIRLEDEDAHHDAEEHSEYSDITDLPSLQRADQGPQANQPTQKPSSKTHTQMGWFLPGEEHFHTDGDDEPHFGDLGETLFGWAADAFVEEKPPAETKPVPPAGKKDGDSCCSKPCRIS